jgi:NAD(P)-dependent dehydrogenase (short-subunit alcohol dehydrogenase family)
MSGWGRPREDLHGRVALVTGGSRGLGLLLARELGRQGCRVMIAARDAGELAAAATRLAGDVPELATHRCDVGVEGEAEELVEATVAAFGRLDVLVNNAGVIQVGPATAMTVEDYRDAMDAMFFGPLVLTYRALPYLREHGGTVINISSLGGRLPAPHLLPYDAAKFALAGLSGGLHAELAADGVHVLTVAPGLMRTGSHLGALFKGDHAREYAWFAAASGMPVLSMDAERAARRIVDAARRHKADLVLTPGAHLATRAYGLAPGLTARALTLVNRLLPAPPPHQGPAVRGAEARRKADSAVLDSATGLNDTAADRFQSGA